MLAAHRRQFMKYRLAVRIAAAALLAYAESAFSQPVSSAQFFERLLSTSPKRGVIKNGQRTVGEVRTWEVTDRKSSYSGLVLCLLDLDASAVSLDVDGRPSFAD